MRSSSLRHHVAVLLSGTAVAVLPFGSVAHADSKWQGTFSEGWFTPGNWDTGTVPTSTDDVDISTETPNAPTIAGGAVTAKIDIGKEAGSTGGLAITNGGTLTSSDGTLGTEAGATGNVLVIGASSRWTSSGSIVVGALGTGTLSIDNGAVVEATTSAAVGRDQGSSGTIFVDGNGSQFIVEGGSLTIGGSTGLSDNGAGVVKITNGGSVTAPEVALGATGGASGSVTIDGMKSQLTSDSDLIVGALGSGSLTVQNGGTVVGKTDFDLGQYAGGSGTAVATGAGSQLYFYGTANIGMGGAGKVSILDGASFNDAQAVIGSTTGGISTVMVDGVDSTWITQGSVVVGGYGEGHVTVSGGATVSSGDFDISGPGFDGTADVTGRSSNDIFSSPSTLTSSGTLLIGYGGTGKLNVTDGALATSVAGTIGFAPGSHGFATISGAGSTWDAGAALEIGADGDGTLTIADKGLVNDGNSILGYDAGSNGSAVVDGAGSLWFNSIALSVGYSGTGNLTIENGGEVRDIEGIVAPQSGSDGTVTVAGAGSKWTNTALLVGGVGISATAGGKGTLTIQDGGLVTAASATLAGFAGSTGTLNIGGDASSAATAAGTLDTPILTFGAGAGTINFNHTDANYVFTPAMSGLGTLNQIAGVTRLTADSSAFTGQTNVVGGKLIVDGILGTGPVNVQSGAALGGSGTIGGPVDVAGRLVGVQGQTLTMLDLTLSNGANVDVTLGAPGGAALFDVSKSLTLDGTLNIAAGGAFGPGVYTLITYGGTFVDKGLDIGATPDGTSASDFSIQTAVAGQVNLVDAAPLARAFWDGDAAGSANNNAVDGGSGIWSATSTNWTEMSGASNGAMMPQPGFAIFEAPGGVVTVDASAGPIAVTGMQFASDGYQLRGDPIALTAPDSIIRVGDGSAAGAGYTATIGSVLTGTGGLDKTDLGTLILTGENDYTGGTTITGGTLQLGDGGAGGAGSVTGDILDNARLVFDTAPPEAFAGSISGSGSVTVLGATMLTGASDYSGGTTVAAGGALSIGSGGASGSITGNIVDDGRLSFDRADSVSFDGAISGNGALEQNGTGVLTLTGDSSGLSGATTVAAGRLSVNGSLATSVVTVKSGANLGGNGVVGGVVAESGSTIAPGNSIGVLHVAGNYSQASGSTYQVELASTGQADRIDVAGTATIANGAVLNVTKLDAAPYVLGTQYKVLDAAGGVSGTFTLSGNTQLSAFIGLALAYDANDVYLDVTKTKSFASAGATQNQSNTGAGLDSLPITNPIVGAALMMPDIATADAAFDQLSGEIHASAKTTMLEDSRLVRDAALGRLLSGQGKGLWGTYGGSWATNDGDGNAATLTRNASSFVVGVDASPAKGLTVGVLGGYAKSNARVPARNSSAKIDSYTVGAYAGVAAGRAKIRFGGAYSWQNIDTNRSVAFAGFSDKLSAGYSASTRQAFGDIGYTIGTDRLNVEPFAQAAWIDVATDAFTETGGAAALKANKQSQNLGVVTLGLRGTAGFSIGGAAARFHATAGWREATGDRTPDASLSFASGGNAFDIAGAPIAKNSALLDTGIDVALTPRLRLNVGYVGQLASHTRDNGVKAGVSMAF